MKKEDGSPVDILAFYKNDWINFDWISRHTEGDKYAQAALAQDPLERDVDLSLRKALTTGKDQQYQVYASRGYVPHIVYNNGNHDIDRVLRKDNVGEYDPYNAAFFAKIRYYKMMGIKNPLKEYILKDIGVTYNDYVHFISSGESVNFLNAAIKHGHEGGPFGKPVADVDRRAAEVTGIFGHSLI